MSTLPRGLFPEIEPRASGMLRLDDLHEMYWEECGNPAGIPVVFLHGGPGAHLDNLETHDTRLMLPVIGFTRCCSIDAKNAFMSMCRITRGQ